MKKKGENVIFEIITCEIEGTTAVVKLRDKYLGITFMDILSFIKIEWIELRLVIVFVLLKFEK